MRFSKLMKRDHSQEKEVSHMLHCAVHHAMECLTLLHCDSHPQVWSHTAAWPVPFKAGGEGGGNGNIYKSHYHVTCLR